MKSKLFITEFEELKLKLKKDLVPYSEIKEISYCNFRHVVNFMPKSEIFCISIKYGNGKRALLYNKIDLIKYISQAKTFRESLKVGMKIPNEIEQKINNLRHEFASTINTLYTKSGIKPEKRGWFFQTHMEFLSMFVNSNAA